MSMFSKKIIMTATAVAAAAVIAQAQVSFGTPGNFNDGWLFTQGIDSAYTAPAYADSTWRRLDLPHDWSIEQPASPYLASATGYLPGGTGTYRKHFEVTDSAARHYVYFEGVYNRSKVYLNGHLIGERPSGYASALYELPPCLRKGDNVLTVTVDHSRNADSRYYTGSGIYRDVYIIAAPDTHIAQWGVGYKATKVTPKRADVAVDVAVENPVKNLTVKAEIIGVDGRSVASATRRNAGAENVLNLRVANPTLWSLDTPNLYTLRTTLLLDGKKIDGSDIRMGIRSLEFTPDRGFALNGVNMKVKGVCLHHDAGVLGAVVPRQVWERRLKNLKGIGVNAIRMSHNPQAPVIYELCDSLGLMVMDEASDEWEFPKRKWLQGWNVGEPGFDGTYDFFEEWIDRDVTDMVRRDRNHPSVILWSIGNEVDYPNDPYSHPILDGAEISQPMYGGYKPDAPDARRIGKIAKRLAACVRAVDDSRPVTGALAGVVMSNETEYPDAVDVVGYNYTEDRYDLDHATYPDRVIYGSENRSDYRAWRDVADRDFIFGQFIWTGADYLGESGRWPSRGLYTGLLDFGSFTKPRGHFRASLWCDEPVAYIGTYPKPRPPHDWLSIDAPDVWNYSDGDTIRVVCYTNAPKARLLLNGKEIGAVKPYDIENGIIHWDVPYSSGRLTAEGLDDSGKVIADYSIDTSGRPYSLRATADVSTIGTARPIAHVTVEVLDEEGRQVKLADNNIRCLVKGPARLLGLENSDNSDMGNYRDASQRAYNGRLLAYIESTGEPGEVTVTFTSPLLKPTSVTLNNNN